MITRRSLFLGSAAVILTPGILMPVKKIVVPETMEIWSIESFRFILSNVVEEDFERVRRQLWGVSIAEDPQFRAWQRAQNIRMRAMMDNAFTYPYGLPYPNS